MPADFHLLEGFPANDGLVPMYMVEHACRWVLTIWIPGGHFDGFGMVIPRLPGESGSAAKILRPPSETIGDRYLGPQVFIIILRSALVTLIRTM